MTLTEATPIADAIVRLLTPHCDRIAIAGSVRLAGVAWVEPEGRSV